MGDGVCVGVRVWVGVSVGVGVSVAVLVGVAVRVAVGETGVGVRVAVKVGVGVRVAVGGTGVLVRVGVAVGPITVTVALIELTAREEVFWSYATTPANVTTVDADVPPRVNVTSAMLRLAVVKFWADAITMIVLPSEFRTFARYDPPVSCAVLATVATAGL